MRPHRLVHPVAAAVVLLAISAACTSAVSEPQALTSSASPGAAAPSPGTPPAPVPTDPPGATAFEVTGQRIAIRPPAGGSFRVRGTYPSGPSPCVRPDRPRLEGDYPGTLSIRTAADGSLTATVTLPFERYLQGIAEVPPSWPRAALEAQAIAARSYVLSRTGWSGAQGEDLDTPICASTDCQVYGGIPHPRPPGIARWYRAVAATRGQVLLAGDRPADTVYFSTSNGRTYGNDEIFGSSPLPYLRPVVERDDGASPVSRWRVELPFSDLETVLGAAGVWPAGASISRTARVGAALRISGGGETRTIDEGTFRDAVNTWAPCLLPSRYPKGGLPVTVPSRWFDLAVDGRSVIAEGRGWGHGAGLVQWGAYGKAVRGWSAGRILSFYYGGLTPQPYPEPGSMKVIVATGVRSLTVTPTVTGATIGERTLGTDTLRVSGGAIVTVSSRASATPAEVQQSEPRFEGSVTLLGSRLRDEVTGRNWHPGCPVGLDDLRHVQVSYWDFEGQVRTGPLIVHETVARDVLQVFRRLFAAGFPIHRIDLPPRYRPPEPRDWYSTRNLTAAFNCRPATGNPGSLSHHSYGWAIDINPLQNPYVRSDGSVLRRAVKPYLDRSLREPGMIHRGDVVVRAFVKIGWEWGGDWVTLKDHMHFSLTGR